MNLFAVNDLKVFLPGAGLALTAGLLLGGAMQPRLDASDNRPAGPQMLADWAGARSSNPADPGATFAAYHGNPPDYVLGTDWKKSSTWPSEQAAVSPPRETVADAAAPAEERPQFTRAAYDRSAPNPVYPSLGGRAAAAASATDADVAIDDDTLPSIEG